MKCFGCIKKSIVFTKVGVHGSDEGGHVDNADFDGFIKRCAIIQMINY